VDRRSKAVVSSHVSKMHGEVTMFCPECGSEYSEGLYECAECKISLVPERPAAAAPPESPDLVKVMETADPALISIAKSVLEGSGIWFVAQGEGASSLLPGSMGIFPVRFFVDRESVERAEVLLKELEVE
jgi:hypothetical protein